MTRTLIVYHSRTGYTRRVATALARRLHADVEEIHDVRPVEGPLGYVLCAIEALLAITPAVRRPRHAVADYQTIVVGTPVWFWSLSSPVRTWLAQHRLAGKRVAFFCTIGGAGAERALATMADVAGVMPVATLAMADGEIDGGGDAKLGRFVRAIAPRAAARARPRHRVAHA